MHDPYIKGQFLNGSFIFQATETLRRGLIQRYLRLCSDKLSWRPYQRINTLYFFFDSVSTSRQEDFFGTIIDVPHCAEQVILEDLVSLFYLLLISATANTRLRKFTD